MANLKVMSWNVEHMQRLVGPGLTTTNQRRRDAVINEVRAINPDIWCLLEGPKGESDIDSVSNGMFGGDWIPVKSPDGDYRQLGEQWIWFLVKPALLGQCSLLPVSTWQDFTGEKTFEVFRWGESTPSSHKHYRHPQTLIVDWNGQRIELIGLHLKSKFINRGQTLWNNPATRPEFIKEAVEARMKMAREATDVRSYIDKRFSQTPNPAIFVMGDLNDGPGKEWFEDRFLFFDLIGNVQGDVFFARRYLFHALFDFPQDLRWTAKFKDFVVNDQFEKPILLDHILFTQSLTDGSIAWRVPQGGGMVEHEAHDLANASLPQSARTSDHRPVTVTIETN